MAEKLSLLDIQQSEYVQGEDEPSFLITIDQRKVSRCNVFAAVIGKEEVGNITNIILDDGTAQLVLRSFEPTSLVRALQLGEVIGVMGRVRVYNGERYLSPEIVKKINPLWLKVRKKELGRDKLGKGQEGGGKKGGEGQKIEVEEIGQELVVDGEKEPGERENEGKEKPEEVIMRIVREKDTGAGVPVEELLELVLDGETEKGEQTELLIEKMQRDGLLFQNAPGRVKVL